MISHYQQVNGRITQVNGDSDRLRGQESSAPWQSKLEIEPGEVFYLLGADGAGKTTINLFLNFIEPTSGTAMIKGLDMTKEPLDTKRYILGIEVRRRSGRG